MPVDSGLPKAKDIRVYVIIQGTLFDPGVLKLRLVMKTLKGQRELLQASRDFNYHISVLILTSDDDNYFIQNELMTSLCRG